MSGPRRPFPYETVTEHYKKRIMSGELKAGDRLPGLRADAATFKLARETVARAYHHLERDDFIILTRGRNGAVVAPRPAFQAASDETDELATLRLILAELTAIRQLLSRHRRP